MSDMKVRKQNQRQEDMEMCDICCPLSDLCCPADDVHSDRFRIAYNLHLGMQDSRVEEFFDNAAKKHWRKADKAVVFGYLPGKAFDFLLARDLDRIIKPESSWVRAFILGTNLKIAYEEESTVEVHGNQIAYGQVFFYATDERGNYRNLLPEELGTLFDFIVQGYSKIVCRDEVVEALSL